jgi:hypothetical protein
MEGFVMKIQYKRLDGTFVAVVNGLPYHVIDSDPLFAQAQIDGQAAPLEPALPPQTLAAERAAMKCTPMQGQLALGETNWGVIVAWRDSTATWAQKVIIDSAQTWVRNSQNIAFFQYLLSFTDEQVDDLFRAAALIDA